MFPVVPVVATILLATGIAASIITTTQSTFATQLQQ